MQNQRGDIATVLIVLFVIGVLFTALFVRFKASDDVTSGIAYNTRNNALISGNTNFSVRAGENTPIDENNESSYCLPPNSPYKALVNKAAADKNVKITVEAGKYFAIQMPWECNSNVVVKEVK